MSFLAAAGPPVWSDYLITPDGRCVRHPDKPEPRWCLECWAIHEGCVDARGAGADQEPPDRGFRSA